MKQFLILGVSLSFIVACSNQAEQEATSLSNESIEEVAIVVNPNTLLSIEVDGMSCEMACGGSIREGLMDTKAVSRVQFDFEMGRETNTAKISFDNAKITQDEIVKIVTSLNNHQFTVGEASIESIEATETGAVEENQTSKNVETANVSVDVERPSFHMPNFIDLFRTFIHFSI